MEKKSKHMFRGKSMRLNCLIEMLKAYPELSILKRGNIYHI